MIARIQGYTTNSKATPKTFCAVQAKNSLISVKRRGENLRVELPGNKFFVRLKDIFFEIFPKLDSEYRKIYLPKS